MKSKKVLWIVIAVVVVLALVGVNIARQAKGNAIAVQFARVRAEDITQRVRAPGKIEPKTQVKISADVPGKVTRLLVKEGDRVRQGQLMLQLDDTQYRANYNQARAALASAQARIREADAALKVSDASYARQRALFDQKLLSQAEWDQATSSNESAHVAQATAREEVSRSQSAMDGAADNLSKTRFVAPFDGVVSSLDVEQGEIVVTGTMNNPGTQILVVSDLSRMLVRADVDETDVVNMKIGQKAKISVDAIPDTTFVGTVTEIGNTAKRSLTSTVEGQTNFEVKVVFDDLVPQIRPGMTADVDIETATHAKTVGVPIQAVVVRTQRELDRAAKKSGDRKARKKADAMNAAADEDTVGRKDPELTGVFAVKNGVAQFVPVRTGISSETMIEIFGAVKPGEQVVAGPYKALRELKPNAKVKAEAPGKAAGGRP
ncbi:MAG TPA: efflux RND transporter periplasmic adaptor subunit [Candidatus Saccharimonadaceae bacterium]|jgi:HlyD family secretion protein|nr:efflux RND transporter periplasmic adaptor subunit [Candidatus Saccharimonadaceae bacterium]